MLQNNNLLTLKEKKEDKEWAIEYHSRNNQKEEETSMGEFNLKWQEEDLADEIERS